jgi:CheY-like chemotaxis protein
MNGEKVLVVDDDVLIRESLRDVLMASDYEVLTAANGQDAIDVIKKNGLPNVVLLDLMMPVMNGWEFMGACQKDPRMANLPVVIVSAVANQDTAYGAAGYLRKPIKIENVLNAVSQICKKKHLMGEES